MDYSDNIRGVLRFIEQNIKTDISPKQLSEVSSFSIPHLYRLFNNHVGCSPSEYIKKRKLFSAANELFTGTRRIIDVALDYGFESHDVFTRAFKRVYEVNPEYYRRHGYCLPDFMGILPKIVKGHDSMHNVEIVTFPQTHLIGVENRLNVDEWAPDVFHRMRESVFNNAPNLVHPPCIDKERPYTCATHILSIINPDYSYNYFAGVEVKDFSDVPQGVATRIIPEAMFAVIGYEGGLEFKEIADYLHGEWLENNEYFIAADEKMPYSAIEWYSPHGFDIYEERVYVPIKPICYDIKKVDNYSGICFKAINADRSKAKDAAFEAMFAWATDNNLFGKEPVKFEVRYDKKQGCEIFYKTAKNLSEFTNNIPVEAKSYPGGVYAIAPVMHNFLEAQERAVMRMLRRNKKYKLIGPCHEEYILHEAKLDAFTKVHYCEGVKRQ